MGERSYESESKENEATGDSGWFRDGCLVVLRDRNTNNPNCQASKIGFVVQNK